MTSQLVIFRVFFSFFSVPPPTPPLPTTLNLKKKNPVNQLIKKIWPYITSWCFVLLMAETSTAYHQKKSIVLLDFYAKIISIVKKIEGRLIHLPLGTDNRYLIFNGICSLWFIF